MDEVSEILWVNSANGEFWHIPALQDYSRKFSVGKIKDLKMLLHHRSSRNTMVCINEQVKCENRGGFAVFQELSPVS